MLHKGDLPYKIEQLKSREGLTVDPLAEKRLQIGIERVVHKVAISKGLFQVYPFNEEKEYAILKENPENSAELVR